MDRFDFATLPFNQLTGIQPFPKFKTAAQLKRDKWYGDNNDDNTPTFEELVTAHDEKIRDDKLDSYNSRARTRWTVIDHNTLRRERYANGKLSTIELPTGHINVWGQRFDVTYIGDNPAIRIDFADMHATRVHMSPVVVYHDKLNIKSIIHPGEQVVIDRINRDNIKDGSDTPVNSITNTLWTKDWVTISLMTENGMIGKLKLRVRSSLFNGYEDCCEFQPPDGEKVVMLDSKGDVCSHGIGAVESIKIGDTVYDAPIAEPVFFWFYQERHRTNEDGINVPRKQPLLQQTQRKSRIFKKGDKGWLRLNHGAFAERFTVTLTAPSPGIIVSSRQAENYHNLGIVSPSRENEGIRMVNGERLLESVDDSYDYADEQEESRYQRMLDKHDDDMDTNVADRHVYDEIAQEDFVSTLDSAHEIQQYASDDFEIGSNGTVFEKHENLSVRNDEEDAEMMNLTYLTRALDVSEERAAEIQAQLDVMTVGDNEEKNRWIQRLQGRSDDMTSDDAYKWLAECSDALLELESDTEEINVASTSDFSQADITITVGTSDDTRIDPAEEKELAVHEIHEMLDDGSGNPALAPKHMESYSDLLGELHNLTSAYQRKTTHETLTLNSDNVQQFEFLKTTTGNGSPRFETLRREIHRKFQPRKQTQQLIDRINAKGRLWVWERAHENQIERASVLNTVPGVISAIKLVNAMMKYDLADNMVDANERLRKVVDDHPVVGYHTLKFANQFFHASQPPAPTRGDRDWTPPAEDIHAAERELEIQNALDLKSANITNPFDLAKLNWFRNAPARDKTFRFIDRQQFAQSPEVAAVRPYLDVTATPSYGYHKIESNNVPDSPYTQMVELQRKLWDLDNLTRNGKPNPLWLYRIYPRLQGNDGTMLKTRRQATETSIAFFHKDAPPAMPKLGVHNGGEEYVNGSEKTFIYKDAQWMK